MAGLRHPPRLLRALPRLFSNSFAALGVLFSSVTPALAQGVLTITPGRTFSTTAGTGQVGYRGDGIQAVAAQLAGPSGVAYDAAGDLFLADANNHVVREVSTTGLITTVAGTGTAGYGGDGGPATSAYLDTPTSIVVGANGDLYIADSHNHRIRKVSQGLITTVAGTGTRGYSGDSGPATSAQLALPSSVVLDTNGNLYIADTNNNRIRKVSSGTITTIAGNGEELFAGDGGPAILAALDQPTGITLDAAGNLYVADKNNHRVRLVNTSGTISTVAGNGASSFSGSYAGDSGPATQASLARPVGVSADAAGNIFVADTNNQRIRQISPGGAIATVVGSGEQGYAGDGAFAINAILNNPRALVTDFNGSLTIADSRNQRIRIATLSTLSFSTTQVSTPSSAQSVTLSNTGTSTLVLIAPAVSGPFQLVPGGTCGASSISLSPGSSCTQQIAFVPITSGSAKGSATFSGQGVVGQTVLLSGTAATTGTVLTLATDKPAALAGEAVTLTATLSSPGGAPLTTNSGSVNFYVGGQLLGAGTLNQGKASYTTSSLPNGAQQLTASFAGTSGFGASSSTVVSATIADFSLGLNNVQAVTIAPGRSVSTPATLNLTGANGLSGKVTLSTGTLPAGLTFTFSPASVSISNGQLSFLMNITAAPVTASSSVPPLAIGSSALSFAVLLLPGLRRRRTLGKLQIPGGLIVLIGSLTSLAMLSTLTGCGAQNGFFGQKQQTYNVTVTATANDTTGGTLARSTVIPVMVQ